MLPFYKLCHTATCLESPLTDHLSKELSKRECETAEIIDIANYQHQHTYAGIILYDDFRTYCMSVTRSHLFYCQGLPLYIIDIKILISMLCTWNNDNVSVAAVKILSTVLQISSSELWIFTIMKNPLVSFPINGINYF